MKIAIERIRELEAQNRALVVLNNDLQVKRSNDEKLILSLKAHLAQHRPCAC